MNRGRPLVDPALRDRLEVEILRWNNQINLVTRVDTERQVAALLDHCLEAWLLISSKLGEESWFSSATYLDLGSGAGFPGLVWALARREEEHTGPVILVEPRGKRAWFLRRTARLLGLTGLEVVEGRWGSVALSEGGLGPGSLLVSLKALRLSNADVLGGVANAVGADALPAEVLVVRFLAPTVSAVADRSRARERGVGVDPVGLPYLLAAAETIGTDAARLGLTRFVSSSR